MTPTPRFDDHAVAAERRARIERVARDLASMVLFAAADSDENDEWIDDRVIEVLGAEDDEANDEVLQALARFGREFRGDAPQVVR